MSRLPAIDPGSVPRSWEHAAGVWGELLEVSAQASRNRQALVGIEAVTRV